MKRRVLLVNKFYYRRGGDCVYLLNLERMLRSQGHEVAVFAMDYPQNHTSEWSSHFASEVSFQGGMAQKLKAVGRTLGWGDINTSFNAILDSFRPDVVHLNNIHSYLSPQIAELAHKRGIKTVWTMHDYKLLCPSYSCLRNGDVCEACIDGNKINVLKNRCMKGALAPSLIAWLEAAKWDKATLTACTDRFICPSEFISAKMVQGGFPVDKIITLNNFINPSTIAKAAAQAPSEKRDGYYAYVGRLSEEKGVETLLKAASSLPYKLKIAGDGPIAEKLRENYSGYDNIEFLGHLDGENVNRLLDRARFTVVPSEWYENNPFSIIESLCAGTPVLGAEIGGIPELISDDNGLTFTSADTSSLTAGINKMWERDFDHLKISLDAIARFNPERYYKALNKIYEE